MNHLTFDQLPAAVASLLEKVNNIERLLNEPNQSAEKTDDPLTVQEAATFLHLAPPTIYALISKKEIPFMKRGKRVYFSKPELTKWLMQGKQKTVSEIQVEALNHLFTKKR